MWDVVKGTERLTPDEESPPAPMQISPQNWGLFSPDGGLGKGPGAWMGGPGRVSWYSSSLSGGVFSTQLQGFGQAEFGSSNFPFKRGWNVGAGRFYSSWPGRGSGAYSLTHPPPTPRGLGEEEAPTLTGRWAWTPVGKAFPGPPDLKTAPPALA